MKRRTSMCAGVLLALAPLVHGQASQSDSQNQASPRFSEDALASQQLIAWSWMQKPQPTPQPLPPPDPSTTPPANPQAQQPPSSPTQSQTFTGKIVKDGGKYVLKVAGNTAYQLDQQSSAGQYENQDVRIVGTLDSGSNTIHVTKIELLS